MALFQKRHYAVIADALHRSGASYQTIEAFAEELKGTNPGYQRDRFIRAATGAPDGRDVAALRRARRG